MSDQDEPPVVPIRPGVQVRGSRAVALLEHFTEAMAEFTRRTGEQPESVVFVIHGPTRFRSGWMIEGENTQSAVIALSGALLLADAVKPSDD